MNRGLLFALSFIALGSVAARDAQAATSSTEVLNLATSTSGVLDLVTSSTAPVVAVENTAPVMLRMADGRFYHPATGKVAASREDLLFLLGLAPSPSLPGTSPVPETPTSTPFLDVSVSATTTLPVFALRTALEEGRQLLRDNLETPTSTIYTSLTQQVPLQFAVWNASSTESATSAIQLVTQRVSIGSLMQKGIRKFVAALPNKGIVVGIHYPIINETTVKKQKRYEASYVVYTPYSEDLHTPEMVSLGKARLRSLTQQAYAEFRQQAIPSVAFPGKLLVDVIDPVIPASIVAIEHIDYTPLEKMGEPGLELVYIMIAANPDNVFGYSLSSAGARGLAQFIKPTYDSVVRRNPGLGLDPDYARAMRQPLMSLKAELLYLDMLLQELPPSARERYVAGDMTASEFVVAAYNGGPARISRAMADWDQMMKDGSVRLTQAKKKAAQAASSVAILNKQIKAAKTAATKTDLKKKLTTAQKTNNSAQNQLAALEKNMLRQETMQYILKYRYVAAWMRQGVMPISNLPNTSVVTQTSARESK